MRINLTANLDATDPEHRTIAGLGVPWDSPAVIGGRRWRFRRGSLRAARERTPLLLGHDTQRPVGVLAGVSDEARGAVTTFRVDATPDGDTALVQAASGSRASLSVGCDVLAHELQADGTELVTDAVYVEFSLVPSGAFAEAGVERVAAEETPEPEPEPEPDDDEEDDVPPETPEPEPEVAASIAPVRVLAERRAELPRYAGEYVNLMLRAERGDTTAVELFAALAVGDIATNPGVLPPNYTSEILGSLPVIRPLAGVALRRPLPATGMSIIKPVWTTQPAGGWVTDADPTPSNKAAIGSKTVAVKQWAYGIGIKWALAERSTPDYADAVYARALADYANDVEVDLAAEIVAAVTANAGGATTLGEALAHFFAINNAGANVLLLAPDAAGEFIDAEGFLKYSSGSMGSSPGDGFIGTVAGLDVIVSGTLAAGTSVVGSRSALELRESAPARLTANNIGALELELGVTSFASYDVEVPTGFVGYVPVPPVGTRSSSAARK